MIEFKVKNLDVVTTNLLNHPYRTVVLMHFAPRLYFIIPSAKEFFLISKQVPFYDIAHIISTHPRFVMRNGLYVVGLFPEIKQALPRKVWLLNWDVYIEKFVFGIPRTIPHRPDGPVYRVVPMNIMRKQWAYLFGFDKVFNAVYWTALAGASLIGLYCVCEVSGNTKVWRRNTIKKIESVVMYVRDVIYNKFLKNFFENHIYDVAYKIDMDKKLVVDQYAFLLKITIAGPIYIPIWVTSWLAKEFAILRHEMYKSTKHILLWRLWFEYWDEKEDFWREEEERRATMDERTLRKHNWWRKVAPPVSFLLTLITWYIIFSTDNKLIMNFTIIIVYHINGFMVKKITTRCMYYMILFRHWIFAIHIHVSTALLILLTEYPVYGDW